MQQVTLNLLRVGQRRVRENTEAGRISVMPADDCLAPTPEPPYTAVIFTSRRTEVDDDGYAAMATTMDKLARIQPGFLGVESVRDAERVGITVSYWASHEHARSWKRVAEHLGAQRLGRAVWYSAYQIRIATVDRDYTMGTSPFE
jgi:heme-degrading monooxygenase HmoA